MEAGGAAPLPHKATATVAEFKIALDTAKLAAGEETLSIRNNGKITHEFVVVRTDLAAGALPGGLGRRGRRGMD